MVIVEDEFKLGEPKNLKKYLVILWLGIGMWVFYKDFKYYYAKMSKPREGVDYYNYFKIWNT